MRYSHGKVKYIQMVSLEISVPLINPFPISNLYCTGYSGYVSPFLSSTPNAYPQNGYENTVLNVLKNRDMLWSTQKNLNRQRSDKN